MKLVRLAVLTAAAAVTVPLVALGAPSARADSYTVPFKDADSVGTIGFCDKDNKPLTSGSILDVPFAFKAVSDQAAPKAYAIVGRKATLYAYSPIKNVPPGSWISYQMMPSSVYTDVKHPMAAAGYGEPPLQYQVTGAPPTWDGLVQLRILLSAPNTPQRMKPYPTAVIRVTGTTWVMVQGNRNPDCAAGTAQNSNQTLGKGEPTAPPSWAANATTDPSAQASASAQASKDVASIVPSPSPTDSGSVGSDGSTQAAGQSAGSTSVPNVLPIALALLGGTAIGVAAFAWFAARRQS
jgi:hypothetical protein